MTTYIDWRFLNENDEGWRQVRCLYAYLAPSTLEILYIGMAWNATVRERWKRSGKYQFWDDLEKERGIRNHCPLLGELSLPPRRRLTRALLCDVESLLIQQVQPWGNIQSRFSRISSTGLIVRCEGDWPVHHRVFRDQ